MDADCIYPLPRFSMNNLRLRNYKNKKPQLVSQLRRILYGSLNYKLSSQDNAPKLGFVVLPTTVRRPSHPKLSEATDCFGVLFSIMITLYNNSFLSQVKFPLEEFVFPRHRHYLIVSRFMTISHYNGTTSPRVGLHHRPIIQTNLRRPFLCQLRPEPEFAKANADLPINQVKAN